MSSTRHAQADAERASLADVIEVEPVQRFPCVTALVLSAAIAGLSFYGKLTVNLHSENYNAYRSLSCSNAIDLYPRR